jgi:NADPH-dependent 2,4-dienoyl-CoA reductase/sulfur reductase-like enzyme
MTRKQRLVILGNGMAGAWLAEEVPARKAVVLGGGLLGLEAARGLLNRGLEVHVVHLRPHPMDMQLDSPAGTILKKMLERMGVHFHLAMQTSRVLGNDHVTGLAFKEGSTLDCDMVVISAGIRPTVGLAQQASLTVERGIVVNDDLSCSGDPAVYAIGECAQHPLWIGHSLLPASATAPFCSSERAKECDDWPSFKSPGGQLGSLAGRILYSFATVHGDRPERRDAFPWYALCSAVAQARPVE